jgi:chemotaxis protein CheX
LERLIVKTSEGKRIVTIALYTGMKPRGVAKYGGITMLSNAKTYMLSNVLDLKAAMPLAEGLLAQRGSELMIDASRVERLGAQSLQILLSAVSTWHADGLSIEFVEPSASFIQGLALFGIDPEHFLNGQAPASGVEFH